jgi:hypothetical protein
VAGEVAEFTGCVDFGVVLMIPYDTRQALGVRYITIQLELLWGSLERLAPAFKTRLETEHFQLLNEYGNLGHDLNRLPTIVRTCGFSPKSQTEPRLFKG